MVTRRRSKIGEPSAFLDWLERLMIVPPSIKYLIESRRGSTQETNVKGVIDGAQVSGD